MNRRRRAWVAVLLALVFSPVFGMLYLGRAGRALAYFCLIIGTGALTIALAATGHWIPDIGVWPMFVVLAIAGIADSYRIARQCGDSFVGGWYSRWYGLVAIFVCYISVSLLFRLLIAEPYRMPSGSMVPTLQIGDLIYVNKWAYGVRLPFSRKQILAVGMPQRGDVVVFQSPFQRLNYLKRIVGMPGDRVEYRERHLIINGSPVEMTPVQTYFDMVRHLAYPQFIEHLGSISYPVILSDGPSPSIHQAPQHTDPTACDYAHGDVACTVPAGHYFVMGDNRDNSEDSRYWGFVPEECVVGRVFVVWWNSHRPERAGTWVK